MSEPYGADADAEFVGAIPAVYERLLVPMIFQAPAESLAALVAHDAPRRVLETAAGTGALTRVLADRCPEAQITATDLNQAMLDAAAARMSGASVDWRHADALDLPFEDRTFDAVICQFGVMFFPDRVRGYREALRVLEPAGSFVFNVWDRLESNEVPHMVEQALDDAVPQSPASFLRRTPYGYFSPDQVRADLEDAGFSVESIAAVDDTSRTTASEAATAFCTGTPLRAAIEGHEGLSLATATEVVERTLLRHFGPGPIDAPIRWLEVVARRPHDDYR